MAVLNLLAISSLILLACVLSGTPANALSDGSDLLARHAHAHGHDSAAKRFKKLGRAASSVTSMTSLPDTLATAAAQTPASLSPSVASVGNRNGSTNSSSTPTNFSKKGIAWPNGGTEGLSQYRVKGEQKQLLYTWSPDLPDGLDELGFIGVPMLWGNKSIDDFEKKVQKGYSSYVLGFNEVNEPLQSNLDATTAAALWKQHMNPRKAMGYTLGAPSSSGNPNGIQWMNEFFEACAGECIVDFMTVHWYDVTFEGFQKWVTQWHTEFENRPVWITECACQNFNNGPQCSKDQIFSFVSQATKWAEETDWIQAIFPFGIMKDMANVNPANAMMSASGSITDLGSTFLNA